MEVVSIADIGKHVDREVEILLDAVVRLVPKKRRAMHPSLLLSEFRTDHNEVLSDVHRATTLPPTELMTYKMIALARLLIADPHAKQVFEATLDGKIAPVKYETP